MIRNNKWKLLISSIIIILPALVGILFKHLLPKNTSAPISVMGDTMWWSFTLTIPAVMLVLQWFCVLFTSRDKGNENQSKKVVGMVLWIIPCLTVYISTVMYAITFGVDIKPYLLIMAPIGLLMMLMGNYMPKCKRNRTIGLKLSWTLASDDNWNRTHRFGGKVMVISGALIMLFALIPNEWSMYLCLAMIFAMVIIPTVYSYTYYRKQVKAGEVDPKDVKKIAKSSRIIIAGIALLLVALLLGISFVGGVDVAYGDGCFTVDAPFTDATTVEYAEIDKVEYREGGIGGMKVFGFGGPKLQAGVYNNDELGNYTRYTVSAKKPCVVITLDGAVLAVGFDDAAQTEQLYRTILENTKGE